MAALTALICLFYTTYALPSDLEKTTPDTQLELLAYDPGWLALGHYQQHGLLNRWESEADSDAFFLAPTGKSDPRAELKATLAAFIRDLHHTAADENDSFCRFPARRMWLEQRLDIHFSIRPDRCKALSSWTSKLRNKKISVIFASSYMDSPSSMFGHTYLSFHDDSGRSALLTDTLNYAANTGDRKGIVDFAYRGLFGGFPGVIDKIPNYRRVRAYTENEGRSLWEYPSTLNADETALIAAHLWEIKDKAFDYFFVDENCSYRLLSVIAVARPDNNLLEKFQSITIPIDTIRILKLENIISLPVYWPSVEAKTASFTKNLSPTEKSIAIALANDPFEKNEERLKRITDYKKKKAVLLASLEYISIDISRERISMEAGDKNTEKIKTYLLSLDAQLEQRSIITPPPPDSGHLSSRAGISSGSQGGDLYIGYSYRVAYHDFLDNVTGFDKGAEVNVLALDARHYETGRDELENFTLLGVTSRPEVTPFFQPTSWDFYINAHQRHMGENDILVGDVGYLRGKSFSFGDISLSAMAGANLILANYYQNNVGLEPAMKIDLYEQTNNFFYGANFVYSADTSGHYPDQSTLGLQTSWQIHNAYRLAITCEHAFHVPSHENSVNISLYTYF
jgi:hypothetical protein